MNKFAMFILPCLFMTVSCSGSQSSLSTSDNSSKEETVDSTTTTSTNTSSDDDNSTSSLSKAIVVYFSGSGNTQRVSKAISDHINSPIYEIEPTTPYTSSDLNYSNQSSRVSIEHTQRVNFRNGTGTNDVHVELKTVSFDGFETADYVFLGAPVWWQELSWVIEDFVSLNDFTGKTIIPFGTSASSSFSIDHLKSLTNTGTWAERQRFSSSASASSVNSWVDSLGYNF